MLTGKEIRSYHRIEDLLAERGVVMKVKGNELWGLCPFHKEKTPSFSVQPETQVYYCFGCQARGDAITLVAKMDGISVGEAMEKLTPDHLKTQQPTRATPAQHPRTAPEVAPEVKFSPQTPQEPAGNIVKVYPYTDELGTVLYEVCRIEPGQDGRKKDFRARHTDSGGKVVWGVSGIRRVLYNLPNILRAPIIVKVSGEKDADTVNALGLTGMAATTNVFGEKHWMNAYVDSMLDKEIVIFGDNDETGREHVKQVLASLAGRVKNVRVIFPPVGKDITDYVESLRKVGKNELDISLAVEKLITDAVPLTKGIDLPIYSMSQMEVMYRKSAVEESGVGFDFGKLLPTLGNHIRPARRGELITIVAPTGVGKTQIAQLIAILSAPNPVLFFELELSSELTFERFVGISEDLNGGEVEHAYRKGVGVKWNKNKLDHIYTCSLSRLTPDSIEKQINQSELVIGARPVVSIVDYAQLVGGVGDRYERTSDTAEQMRIIARSTNTIMFLTSQSGRNEDEQYAKPGLHSPKGSGSLENSSRLLLGVYLDKDEDGKMYIQVIKDTKSRWAGLVVPCKRTSSLRLQEIETRDVEPAKPEPKPHIQQNFPPQNPTTPTKQVNADGSVDYLLHS